MSAEWVFTILHGHHRLYYEKTIRELHGIQSNIVSRFLPTHAVSPHLSSIDYTYSRVYFQWWMDLSLQLNLRLAAEAAACSTKARLPLAGRADRKLIFVKYIPPPPPTPLTNYGDQWSPRETGHTAPWVLTLHCIFIWRTENLISAFWQSYLQVWFVQVTYAATANLIAALCLFFPQHTHIHTHTNGWPV